jgi:hypothetical protein
MFSSSKVILLLAIPVYRYPDWKISFFLVEQDKKINEMTTKPKIASAWGIIYLLFSILF